MDKKINLKAKNLDELQLFFHELGEPCYRANQLFSWIWEIR